MPFEVDVDHLLEMLRIQIQERSVGANTGVGDEDVEPTEAIDGGGRDRVESRRVADIAGLGDGSLDA